MHYKYIRVRLVFPGALGPNEHQKIIEEQYANGYRYVGFFPVEYTSNGRLSELDMIFEKMDD